MQTPKRFASIVCAALFAVVLGVSGGSAQDVVVSPLAWKDPKGMPDELPRFKSTPKVEFPTELRSTPDIGYIVIDVFLDAKGGYHGGAQATTQPIFQRLVTESSANWKFIPGRREGEPVNTESTFALIFNPASASEKNPDATPRLLEVATVEVPAPKGPKPRDAFPDQVVFADVSVDSRGVITAVKNAPPGLEEKLIIAAKNWRFAPARQAGKPVAADVRVPFIVVTGGNQDSSQAKRVQPRVTFQAKPVYPFAMRANGMKGEVIVDFVVNIEGRVRDAFVVRSLNPSFDEPALEAVRKWRFEPGRVGDRVVNTHMRVPIVFQLNETEGGGRGPIEVEKKPDFSKLPEALRYDTAPVPVGTARAVYPYELLRAGKTGHAIVRYLVGPTGHVEQIQILESSAPEFGRALAAAIEQFTFEPAIKGGRPSSALQGFKQDFDRDENGQMVDADDLALLRREMKKPESILTAGELDEKLTPRSRRPPVFPVSVPEGMKEGEALIEFLIDEDGRARLPRIISATHESFGYAAMQSIASWRFEPPKRGGKSVVVRVQIPVRFGAPAHPATAK